MSTASRPLARRVPARVARLTVASTLALSLAAFGAAGAGAAAPSSHDVATASPAAASLRTATAPTASTATSLRKMHGVVWWGSPQNMTQAQLEAVLRQPYINGISAFMRWDQLTTDGQRFDWRMFDRVAAASRAVHKPWAGMIIEGSLNRGLPQYVLAGLPADEIITADGGTFAAFWSAQANARSNAVRTAIAARYGTDPNLAQWRVTTHWSTHGEPWFMGGPAGKTRWTNQWNTHVARKGSGTTGFNALSAAYQSHELAVWASYAAKFPSYVSLSQAGGDAFADSDASKPVAAPSRHPERLATWTRIRQLYGQRAVFQFNGVNGGDGACGYGAWLPASFKQGSAPGRIGGQPVRGVVRGNNPMSTTEFDRMLDLLVSRGNSFFEMYGVDASAAVAGTTAIGRSLRASVQAHANGWAS